MRPLIVLLPAVLFAANANARSTAEDTEAPTATRGLAPPPGGDDGFGPAMRKARPAAPPILTIGACKRKRVSVTFPHEVHVAKNKIACKRCHHKGQPTQSCAGSSCHAAKKRGKIPGCEEMSIHKNAYHLLCRSCHKPDTRTTATINGPVRCKECHSAASASHRKHRRLQELR